MLKGLFKKKLTIKEASASLVNVVLQVCKDEWESDSKELLPYLDSEMTQEVFDYIPFEISIALISMELQVIKNLSPDIFTQVYDNVFDMMAFGEWKDYVIETISMEYIPYMQKSIRNNENPLEFVYEILAGKIDYDLNLVSRDALMSVLGTKVGYWRKILENYKIV